MNFCLFLSRPACLLSSDGKLAALVSKKYFVTEGKKRLDICSTVLVQSEDHQTDQTITRITLRSRKTTVVLSCLSSEVMTSSVRWEVNCNCVNKPFFFFSFCLFPSAYSREWCRKSFRSMDLHLHRKMCIVEIYCVY